MEDTTTGRQHAQGIIQTEDTQAMEDTQAEHAQATDKPCRSPECPRRVALAGPSRCAACAKKGRASARRQDAGIGAIMLFIVSLNAIIEWTSRHRRWALALGLLVPNLIVAPRRANRGSQGTGAGGKDAVLNNVFDIFGPEPDPRSKTDGVGAARQRDEDTILPLGGPSVSNPDSTSRLLDVPSAEHERIISRKKTVRRDA